MKKKTIMKKQAGRATVGKSSVKHLNQYPKGWNRKRVESVIAHYENQTEDEAVAEDEAAFRDGAFAMIQVPLKLVSKVQKLLARRAG